MNLGREMRLVLMLAASCVPLFAQHLFAQDEQPVTTLKIGTRIVAVNAVVLDANGQQVRDMNKEDFELKQDGKPIEIRYFSEDSDLPLTLGLLVDTSGSQKTFIEDEIRASDLFFHAMLRRPTDRALLVQFDTEVLLRQSMTSSATALENTLRYLDMPRGPTMDSTRNGTQLYDAIVKTSTTWLGREPGRRAMVLLTDGVDTTSRATLEQAITAAQKADVAVYSVQYSAVGEFGRSTQNREWAQGLKVLQDISSATGGRVFMVTTTMKLRDIFEEIERDMRLQYQMGYTPPESKPGEYHKIELKVAGKKMTIHARKGYYTPE
jgi:Ca-activated chloride channel family protein